MVNTLVCWVSCSLQRVKLSDFTVEFAAAHLGLRWSDASCVSIQLASLNSLEEGLKGIYKMVHLLCNYLF